MRVLILLAAVLVIAGPACAAFWGISGEFADLDPAVSARVAPVLAQRGANAVLLNMRGREQGWYNWVKVQKTWEDSKAAVFWDAPSTLAECDRIQGLGEDAVPMSGSAAPRGANFLSHRFAQELQSITTSMAFRLKNTAGYRVFAPIDPSGLEYDRSAVMSWRGFLELFFGDKSPRQDTNGDTATFNSAYHTNYAAWQDIPMFTSADINDERKTRLFDLWLAKSQADYVGDMCGSLAPLTRLRLNGPAAESVCGATSDASILASRKFVTRIYATDENAVPALDCAAALFGKRVMAAPVKLIPGDLARSRAKLIKLLPYADGLFLDFHSAANWDDKTKTLALDPAFDAVPELAPFVGRFRVERPKLLWIVPGEADTTNMLDAYCVTESAFALDPDCTDLSQFAAVIYLNRDPSISTAILQKLFDYAIKGGIVFLDAYRIGLGNTLHGRKNGQFWWEGLRLGRTDFGDGETHVSLAGNAWNLPKTRPYLAADDTRVTRAGNVKDSTGADYPLLLVRKMGRSGKWVYINVPDVVGEFALVKAIVKDQSGIELPDRSRARVYRGEKCALAVGGTDAQDVSIPCGYDEGVAFDMGSERVFTGKASNGSFALPEKIPPGEARIWAVKPYGKPIVLYADGVTDWAGSLDDGTYETGILRFSFARRAFVSSPERPKSLVVNAKEAAFDYDAAGKLVKITRSGPGGAVQAELRY